MSRQCHHISRHVTNKCDIFLVVEHALSGGEEMVDKARGQLIMDMHCRDNDMNTTQTTTTTVDLYDLTR